MLREKAQDVSFFISVKYFSLENFFIEKIFFLKYF